LRPAFDFAIGGDRDQTRRAVQNGEGEVARLYRAGIELGYAQVVHLGRQIRESVERERSLPAPTRNADHPLAFAPPAWKEPGNAVSAEDRPVEPVSTEERSENAVEALAIDGSGAASEPKSSGAGRRTAVLEFLRQILARGPVTAREVERLAVPAGLLAEGTSIGDSKAFRIARAALGVKTYQQPGRRAGGWIWSLGEATGSATAG
jgi:hypothetical protein